MKLKNEVRVRSAFFGIEVWRKAKKQHVAEKVENRFFHRWIAALGCDDRAFHDLPIVLGHGLPGREIRPVDGKTSDGLAHGARERLECEVAIPPVLLGEPVEHVAQNIDVIGQGQFHYLQFFRIKQMPKRHRVGDKTMERFCDRCFGRGIDQQLRHLICKIVSGGTVNQPILPQRFRAVEDFFCQHVNGATTLGQCDPKRFRATLLKFFEILARQIKAVRVIDADTCHRPSAHQIESEPVNGVKDLWQLDSNRCQIVHIKKATVVDFLSSNPPKRQPI